MSPSANARPPKLGIPGKVIGDIVDFHCAAGRRHATPFRVRPLLPDPNDDFVLELAIAGHCDWIVTHNVKDFGRRLFLEFA